MARELQKSSPTTESKVTHEQISQRAYEIFVERGCPEGRDLEHWLEAEAQLSAQVQQAPAASDTKPAAGRRA